MTAKRKITHRILSVVLCIAMILSSMPAMTLNVAAEQTLNIVAGSKKADPSTVNWENYFGPNKMDTEFAGGVWTDKSVYTGATSELPGVALKDSKNFLVALSAIASNLSITGHTSSPTDTMLVLDLSGSMVDNTYEVGTVRYGNNYLTANGIDMSLINAMIEATNATIDKLMAQNTNNRVGVVLYSGNAESNQAATPQTATVVLPLGRYSGVNQEYLSVDAATTTSTLYTYNWGTRRWQANGQATYVDSSAAIHVSVKDGLKTEAGAAVTDSSKRANGGTYIQNGLYQAMNQFLAVTDTTVPEGKVQAGAERLPVLVLMTDGAPTIATTDYTAIGNSNTGDGTATNDRITFLTQLTAAYVRGRVAAHYQETDADQKDILFLTLGLGTENNQAATNTLYPAGSNETLVGYWNNYLAAANGENVTVISGQGGLSVRREAAAEAMNYVDTYYYANDAQSLIDSFTKITGEIELKAESYATLVEGGNANYSGYVTFEDELGELMHVSDMKGVLMSDGNGGTVLYTGKGVAKSMNEGALGTVDAPNARGDELVRTVKERIPGLTSSQAQQLIGYAYQDQQLYYADEDHWSNYIGWYADANGNYVGFWDKESGYTDAPNGAVYANRSYGYLGVNGDSDMMHVVVLIRTDLATLHQTVFFKIPASLLPTVEYKVTLKEDQPDVVEKFSQETALPMQLVFEVGLRNDINSVNLEQKIAEHLAKGGHIHRNADGTVSFYTNEWAIGNDRNQNGIPDADEVESAMVAESHFHPAADNSRYYYTEDTPVLDANGNPVGGANRPSGTYYHHRYIYNQTARQTVTMPIAEETLRTKAQYDRTTDQWYIPAGTIFSEVHRFKNDKAENTTDTLPYSDFPAVFENGTKQDVYAFLGNNGTFKVAPATGITLRKEVQGTITDANAYTFEITLSNLPAGAAAAPILTDANGDALPNVTMSAMANHRFTVTMPADVTAYISGIPVGTRVQIAEQIGGDYSVVGITVAGQAQAVNAPASAVIPAYGAANTQMVPVVITNAPNQYGDLLIGKEILHNLPSDPAAMATKEFTFRVQLSGEKIKAGDTFLTNENTRVAVDANGFLTYESGEPIRLKNDESITVHSIPAGTAYTVTEDALQGFKLDNINGDQNATAARGTVTANTESRAEFDNRYPDTFVPVSVPVTLDVTKVLTANTPYSGNEEFAFVLQMLLPDGTYSDISDSNGNEYLKVGANAAKQGAFTLTFEDTGTYYLRVIEVKPSEQLPAGIDTPGMDYSTMQALFAVIVTDEDMDGVLEIAVQEEAHVSATPQYTANDPEQISGISVAAVFENIYELNSTATTLQVHKTLHDPAKADIPLPSFSFTMYPSDGAGNVAAGTVGTTVTASALGDATFNIFLNTPGTHSYKVIEDIPAGAVLDGASGKYLLNGMYYDPAVYLYTVVTAPNGSDLAITDRTLVELNSGATVNPVNGVYTAQFTNEYRLAPVQVELGYSKTLNGLGASGALFDTKLVRTDGAFRPLTDANAWSAVYPVASGQSDTVRLTFEQVGIYHYQWTEVIPAGAVLDPESGRYVWNGVTYDNAEYHITVTVTDNGAGGLSARTVIHKLGEMASVNAADFVNTYTVTGFGEVTIGGEKKLAGRSLAAGEFTIGLYRDASCTDRIEAVSNRADGTFSFSPISYTPADLGVDYAEKTYTYYVKELHSGKGGVTHDPNVYTVTVTVRHENGVLIVTPSSNAATLQILNSYSAKAVDVEINGAKELRGDWSAVTNQDFTFRLFAANERFEIVDSIPVRTATVSGAGDFKMALHYEDGEEGIRYFVLKEDLSHKAGGIGYDAGEYHITVNITDPGNGQLSGQVTMYRPGMGNADKAVFTNTYSVEETSITLVGEKSYINSATRAPLAMTDGMFDFLVLEGGNVAARGHSLADGTIQFEPIRYTAPGVHTYAVVEVPGNAPGVAYDEDAAFTVVVTVTDNGDGTLSARADYQNVPVAFENTYTHGAAQVTFNGQKTLNGDWSAVAGPDKVFTFELYETEADFAIGNKSPLDQTTNAADGSFTFGAETYTTEGTHYYVILEKSGAADRGITYDTATQYHITVQMEDDGAGNLIPKVSAKESGVRIVTDAANVRIATVEALNFTNSYEPKPAYYTPKAKKLYEGEAMKAFDFVLSVDGNEKQTKQNDPDGNVVFDTLEFKTAGTYVLKIREKKNALWGLIRWDVNVYTVTLYVVDNGAGQLYIDESRTVITGEKGRADLIFRNAHHSVITKKEVYTSAEPTVSIEGKTVEVNDILLYQISYTNFDSVPVDVTVTDAIPQYTSYVEGSADHGGVYADGKITWTLPGVAPDATVTVSFKVKVTEAKVTVENSATVLEGENEYHTNAVKNPVEEDLVKKEVFASAEPTVSIDGKKVKKGDELLYKITYTNSDDFAAEVTVTDTIPQYTAYVEGSADHGGVYADGKITWSLNLSAGESETVSFKVKVTESDVTVQNQATALEGANEVKTNAVVTPVEKPEPVPAPDPEPTPDPEPAPQPEPQPEPKPNEVAPTSPYTGGESTFGLLLALLVINGGLIGLYFKKKKAENE